MLKRVQTRVGSQGGESLRVAAVELSSVVSFKVYAYSSDFLGNRKR